MALKNTEVLCLPFYQKRFYLRYISTEKQNHCMSTFVCFNFFFGTPHLFVKGNQRGRGASKSHPRQQYRAIWICVPFWVSNAIFIFILQSIRIWASHSPSLFPQDILLRCWWDCLTTWRHVDESSLQERTDDHHIWLVWIHQWKRLLWVVQSIKNENSSLFYPLVTVVTHLLQWEDTSTKFVLKLALHIFKGWFLQHRLDLISDTLKYCKGPGFMGEY